MKPKILYIMSTYNIYGGTPKKTLDLMRFFKEDSVLFVYENDYSLFKPYFVDSGGKVYEGFYGNNYKKYIKQLLEIIDKEKITVIQTQFFKGEVLGVLIKLLRPKIKLIICFVGALPSSKVKTIVEKLLFKKADKFVFISNYVKTEKEKQFPLLKEKNTNIIYNGTAKREDSGKIPSYKKGVTLLSISGLVRIKNIQVLIKAMVLLANRYANHDIHLYVAGDGPMRQELEELINGLQVQKHVFLLGYQENIGGLLNNCDIYLHPCYKEGFGIAVAEAMFASKPIIISNAGALPELIDNDVSGLVVDPHNEEEWVEAIIKIIEDKELANRLSANAKQKAECDFSVNKYVETYQDLYMNLIS